MCAINLSSPMSNLANLWGEFRIASHPNSTTAWKNAWWPSALPSLVTGCNRVHARPYLWFVIKVWLKARGAPTLQMLTYLVLYWFCAEVSQFVLLPVHTQPMVEPRPRAGFLGDGSECPSGPCPLLLGTRGAGGTRVVVQWAQLIAQVSSRKGRAVLNITGGSSTCWSFQDCCL